MNRRAFLKRSGALSAAAMLPGAVGAGRASAQTTIPARISGATYAAKFTRQLPRPPRINLTGLITTAAINMEQFSQQVLTGYPKTKL